MTQEKQRQHQDRKSWWISQKQTGEVNMRKCHKKSTGDPSAREGFERQQQMKYRELKFPVDDLRYLRKKNKADLKVFERDSRWPWCLQMQEEPTNCQPSASMIQKFFLAFRSFGWRSAERLHAYWIQGCVSAASDKTPTGKLATQIGSITIPGT